MGTSVWVGSLNSKIPGARWFPNSPSSFASQPPGKALGPYLAGMGGGQDVIRLGDLTPAKGPPGWQQLCLPDPQGGASWWKHRLSHS